MSFVLPDPFPPPWAERWEEDAEWGLAATLNLNGVEQIFRWIQPSSFVMGSPSDEVDRGYDEILHIVSFRYGYWLADTVCTQALWQAVMGFNPSHFSNNLANPVEQVSWNEVQTFLSRLNKQVPGLDPVLPSEAQWEHSCRGGTATAFCFGKTITPEEVNYNGEYPYAYGKEGVNRKQTVPVKSFFPNAWGLYEMHGNVWEWCADWYGEYSAGPQIDPSGPSAGVGRVLRGGAWNGLSRDCRAACRDWIGPYGYRHNIGFRIASNQRPSQISQTAGSDAGG